jgi:NAD(P)-dependent dehydrogenase (short-subunit alcohol dehydrogenase family)
VRCSRSRKDAEGRPAAAALSQLPLAGRTALVTGASRERGIGRGIALVLAARGADVALNDVGYAKDAATVVSEIEALGRRSTFIRADVASAGENERLVAETVERLGRLDLFVANAGVARWQRPSEITRDDWDAIMGVNLHGVLYGCRAAAAQMRRQGSGGAIVVISSVNAVMPFPLLAAYGASKHAVGLLAGVMAREWGADGISVNHVGPGWVDTNINDPSPDFDSDERRAQARASIPYGQRPAAPREIGEAVAYLAAATYTTGAYLRIDGGLVIGKY